MKTKLTKLAVPGESAQPKAGSQSLHTRCRWRPALKARSLGFILGLCALTCHVHAVLPEPDNVVFGTIALDGRAITAADYDVVIEVRRSLNGPAVASYQMGANARLGDHYSVRVPLESLTPKQDTNAAFTGEVVYIVVSDINGERESRPITVGTRGAFHRLDIGTSIPDSDSDGLLDVWEIAVFGNLGQNGNGDPDGDGISNSMEFIAGTNPNDGSGFFKLTINRTAPTARTVSFFAVTAEGTGYTGYDRIYTLESTTNFALGNWKGVPNYTNVLGNNTTITYLSNEQDFGTFYRCRLQLRSR